MPDLLDFVRSQLAAHKGYLRRVAAESGVAYDTCLRIKNHEGDPGYSKVRALADYFGSKGVEPVAETREAA